jgi:uroporphyrinogen-III synthase
LRPLAGKRVLVTRPRAQAADLLRALGAMGADVALLPAIEIAPTTDLDSLDRAVASLQSYDWVVLTSVNGVRAVADRSRALEVALPAGPPPRLAVIGPATAGAAAELWREPDLMPDEYVSERMAEGMGDVAGKRVLLARADIARRELAEELNRQGAQVEEVEAYRIVPSTEEPDARVWERAPDFVTLTSSSAARATVERLQEQGVGDWLERAKIVCIGPITAATVRELGYEVAAEAGRYTVPGLLEALRDCAAPSGAKARASSRTPKGAGDV